MDENTQARGSELSAGLGGKMVSLDRCVRIAEFIESLPEDVRKKYLIPQSVSEALKMFA